MKRTLAFAFPANAAQPNLADMVRFVKALTGDQSMMETAYKISDEKSVFIRFKSEEAMQFSFENNDEMLPFHYTDGKEVMVRMSIAGGNNRYVRVFDLPPEISDLDLTAAMAKFGKVHRTVRERFPAEFQLDMYTGVRGVYMDIQQEIPEVLYFRHRKGRVYYDGIKTRCYACRSDGHLKKCCPLLQERRAVKETLKPSSVKPDAEILKEVKDATDAAGAIDNGPCSGKQKNKQAKQKGKKVETKRQHSSDSDAETQIQKKPSTDNPSSSKSVCSPVTVPDRPPEKRRFHIPSYEWIEDEKERQLLIQDDQRRIAEVYNMHVDLVEVYHN